MVRNYKIKPKVYSLEKLRVAVGSVVCKEMTASQASRFYQIPRMTIVNHVNGKVLGYGRGRRPIFTVEQEQKILEIIFALSEMALPLDVDGIRAIVKTFVAERQLRTPFRDGNPGLDWVYG
jgi:hypothetical protein